MGNKVVCLWEYKMVLSLWLKICHFFCMCNRYTELPESIQVCSNVQVSRDAHLGSEHLCGSLPQKETVSHRVALAVPLEVGLCEISPFHVGMSMHVVILLILFRQLHCWEFTGATSLPLSPSRLPSHLFLTIFLLFCVFFFFLSLGCQVALEINQSYPLYLTSCRFL